MRAGPARVALRLLMVLAVGAFLSVLAVLAGAAFGGRAAFAANTNCAVNAGTHTATITLSGTPVTLSSDGSSDLLIKTGSGAAAQCDVANDVLGTDITTISFTAPSATSQTVTLDLTSGTTTAFCSVTFAGAVSTGTVSTTNALFEIKGGSGESLTVGSDGVFPGACSGALGAPTGIGEYELLASGTGVVLSALGANDTNATTTPVTFVASPSGGTFKSAAAGTTIDFSSLPNPLYVNTTSSFVFTPLGFIGPNTAATNGFSYDFTTGGADANHFVGGQAATTYYAGSTGGYSFGAAAGTGSIADFSNASAVTVDMSAGNTGTASFSGGSDNLSGISDVVGSNSGGNSMTAGPGPTFYIFSSSGSGNTFIGGAGDYSFTANGNSNIFKAGAGNGTFNSAGSGNTVDFSALPGSITVNVAAHNASSSSASYNFSSFGTTPTTFKGAAGGATFNAAPYGGFTFVGTGGTNSSDFSSATSGVTVNLSSGPSGGSVSGLAANSIGNSTTDTIQGITTVVGSTVGGNSFTAGPGPSTYTFTAGGTGNSFIGGAGADSFTGSSAGGNTFVGGSGTATFTDNFSTNTFKPGTGSVTIVSSGSGNTIDFSALTGALTVNVSGITVNGLQNEFGSTTSPTAATYDFHSFVTTAKIIGSAGGTTFLAGNNGGWTFQGTGGSNVADFSGATSPITANFITSSVTVAVGTDTLNGISSVIGSSAGGNTFIAGSASESFGDTGSSGGDIVDFTNVGASASFPLTINVSGSTVSSGGSSSVAVPNFTANFGTVNYNFTNGGANFTKFIGAVTGTGNTAFIAGSHGGYTFCTVAACDGTIKSSDTIDFTSAPSVTVDLSTGASGTVSGLLIQNGHTTDAIDGLINIIGSSTGGNTFIGGPSLGGSLVYTFTGNGTGNTFEAGTGSATFLGSGSGNTVQFDGADGPTGAVVVNVSGTQAGSLPTGEASSGAAIYDFHTFGSAATTFIGGSGGTTFFAGSIGDTFSGDGLAPAGSNVLSFSNFNDSGGGFSLVFCVVGSTGNGTSCAASGQAALFNGSVREPFSNVTVLDGLKSGNTTYVAGNAGGFTFNATGTSNTADFSFASNAITANLNTGTVTVSGGSDTITGIASVLGSKNGHNSFIAGANSETFGDIGSVGGDSIDFTNVGTTPGSPLTVNVSSGASGGVQQFTATVGGATYRFQTGGSGFTRFIGSLNGNTDFLGGATGGYTFCTVSACSATAVSTDTLDLSAAPGVTVDLSTGPSGTVTIPSTSADSIFGIINVIGSALGGNTFHGGPALGGSLVYTFTGQGSSNTFFAGSGSATFIGNGSSNTIRFDGAGGPTDLVTVNVSGSQVGSLPTGEASDVAGSLYTFTTFGSNPITFFGGSGGTDFFGGTAADTFNGKSGATNELSFTHTSGTSLTFCVVGSTGNGTTCAASGQAAILNGSLREPFSFITTFDGLTSGNTTFVAGNAGGFTFNGFGSGNIISFSTATSGITANLHTGVVTVPGGTDAVSGISSVVGSAAGGNTFVAGTGSEQFTDTGAGGDTVDFSAVSTGSSNVLIVNISGNPAGPGGSVANDTAAIGGTTYTFTGTGPSTFTRFIGATSGNTDFVAPDQLGGYTFTGKGLGNTVDFSANTVGVVANVSQATEGGLSPDRVLVGSGQIDTLGLTGGVLDIATVIGSASSANTFYAGLLGTRFQAASSINTLSYIGMSTTLGGVTVNVPQGKVTRGSITDTFNFGSGVVTLVGSAANDIFIVGSTATVIQGGGGSDALDLSSITSGVTADLSDSAGDPNAGTISGPSINGTSFTVGCADPTALCLSSVKGTTSSDTFVASPDGLTSGNPVTILGNGGSDVLNLGQIASPAVIDMPIPSGTPIANSGTCAAALGASGAVCSGAAAAPGYRFQGISTVLGTANGGDHVFVGQGSGFTFVESGTTSTLDFSTLPSAAPAGVTINAQDQAGLFTGTVTSPVSVGVGSSTADSFTGFSTFIGTPGADSFVQSGNSPTDLANPADTSCADGGSYCFLGRGGSNTLDLSGAPASTVTLNAPLLSDGCSAGLTNNDGTATGNGVSDQFSCVGTIKSAAAVYQVAPGQSATINGGGSGTLELIGGVPGPGATINLANGTVTGDGYNFSFTGMSTVEGTPGNDTFLAGPGNFTIIGNGGNDAISFANAPSAVVVNDSSSPYTIPTGYTGAGTEVSGFTTFGGFGGTLTLNGIANIIGTAQHSDILVAPNTGVGFLTGGAGADRFVLTGGIDFISGGTGGSTLDLSLLPGYTTIDMSSGPQFLGGPADGGVWILSGNVTTVIASPGGSTILAAANTTTLIGGPGNDTLKGNIGNETLNGGGGNDTLAAGQGTFTLIGGAQPVVFVPGVGGTDTITSPTTGNTLSYLGSPSAAEVNLTSSNFSVPSGKPFGGTTLQFDTATGGAGATVSLGQAGITNLIGSGGNDIFVVGDGVTANGNGGNDLFVIFGGNNTLTAAPGSSSDFLWEGGGSNVIDGGGNSTVDFSEAPAGVIVNLQAVPTGTAKGGFGGTQTLTGVLNIIGSRFSDILVADQAGATINGLDGSDFLEASAFGNDTLISGGSGTDTFCAESSTLANSCAKEVAGTTAGGNNVMIGGSGNDTFFTVNSATDVVTGGGGDNFAVTDPVDVITDPTRFHH
ncbi:MAG TPA: hypothetical protein VKI19_08705 [Acidimicrobiales bacterium]|nr:hypothetical protein [Acidimicrobiales bacterium]